MSVLALIRVVTDKTKEVIRNISTFMPNFGSHILYLLLLTIRYFAFWFYLRYKIKYMLFDFYFAKFNFLCFISTLSNHLPTCAWFYLRYKIRKIIQSSVLSFVKVVNFLLPSQFSLYCWVEDLLSGDSPPIMQSSFACSFSGCA